MIIKICGIKNESTLLCCEKNNVDFFGMIFYKNSPRNISKEKAQYLLELSKNMNIEGVGVFVDENINSLNRITISINGLFLGQDTRFRQIKYHMGVLQAPRYSIELRG